MAGQAGGVRNKTNQAAVHLGPDGDVHQAWPDQRRLAGYMASWPKVSLWET